MFSVGRMKVLSRFGSTVANSFSIYSNLLEQIYSVSMNRALSMQLEILGKIRLLSALTEPHMYRHYI